MLVTIISHKLVKTDIGNLRLADVKLEEEGKVPVILSSLPIEWVDGLKIGDQCEKVTFQIAKGG